MARRSWLALLTLIAAASLIYASQTNGAYRTLHSARIFSLGGVGYAGKRTAEENAYDRLIRAADSEKQLRHLLTDARTPAGKLYALYGLRQLRVRDYWDLAMPYRRNHELVDTAFGCSVGRQSVSEAIMVADRAYAIK